MAFVASNLLTSGSDTRSVVTARSSYVRFGLSNKEESCSALHQHLFSC